MHRSVSHLLLPPHPKADGAASFMPASSAAYPFTEGIVAPGAPLGE